MSHVTDLVEAEAAAAEAAAGDTSEPGTTPGTEPGEPGEPAEPNGELAPAGDDGTPTEPGEGRTEAPEPGAPSAQLDEPPANADLEALEKELARHWKQCEKIMGPDFDFFVPCPVCEESGSPLAGRIAAGVMAPHVEYRTRPDLEPCPDCAALGLMRTGSKVEGQNLLPCPKCNGAGYTQVIAAPVPHLTAVPTGEDPRATELRNAGYVVVPPYQAPA